MDKFGLVLSDSRRVESGGQSYYDNFDKIFSANDALLIGAFAGLVEFDGMTVGQHVQDIVREQDDQNRLDRLATRIGQRLAEKLCDVNDNEVAFEHRKLELLLVGRSQLAKGRFRICSIEMRPDITNHAINPTTKLWPDQDYYVTIGDDQARAQIRAKLPSATKKFLMSERDRAEKLATRAVSHGIGQCGMHSIYSNIASCGGDTRMRGLP